MDEFSNKLGTSIHQFQDRLQALRLRIDELQSGRSSGRFVLFNHDPTGLGGQIARRVLAIRVGLISNRTAVFIDEDFFPYENAFRPLASFLGSVENLPELDERLDEDPAPVVIFNFWSFWQNEPLKAKIYGHVPNELSDLDEPKLAVDGTILSSFRLTREYEDAIAPYLNKIGSLWPIIGVHFRRGDKFVETPYVSAATYRASIESIAGRYNIRNVFVSSDSADAVSELDLDPTKFNIFFDESELRYNNANHKFLMKNPDLASQETKTAIRNIYMLSKCTKLVGQSNAHFASLAAGGIIVNNAAPDFGLLIEPTLAPTSWKSRLAYRTYQTVRHIAKAAFPKLTLRHVKRGKRKAAL